VARPRRPARGRLTVVTASAENWAGVLVAAASVTGQDDLERAGEGLRLAWATEGAVRADTAANELWWLRLAEAIVETAADLDLIPGSPGVGLGTGPGPRGQLPDTPGLRRAILELLAAVRDTLAGYAGHELSGAETIAVALARRSAARAASAASTT
jgi:hypothetical protein